MPNKLLTKIKKFFISPSSQPFELPVSNSSDFYYYEQYGMRHLIKLEYEEENNKLHIYSLSDNEYIETILFAEIIGCTLVDNDTTLIIHMCPQISNQPRIYREMIFKTVNGGFIHPSWYHHLNNQLKKFNLLIIINPSSGSKNGLIEYDTQIRPILTSAGCKCETFITKCAGDATQYIKNVNLDNYDKLIIFGGDGTVLEIINGLLQNNQSGLDKQIGIIPTGSGNGLVRSLLYESNEPFSPIGSIFRLLKCDGIKIPLIKNIIYTQNENIIIYSFLAIAWGMPSDVDIESEFYRFLGTIRFTLGTIMRLINLKSYHGEIKYLEAKEENLESLHHFMKTNELDPEWKSLGSSNDEYVILWSCNAPYVAQDMLVAPSMNLQDKKMSLIVVKHPISRYELISMFWSLERGEHINHEKIINHHIYGFQLTPNTKEKGRITIDGDLIPKYTKISSVISEFSFRV
jgi:sphingosine kinase